MSGDDVILQRRAERYATPERTEDGSTAESTQVLLFNLGPELYALELRLLVAVQSARGLTPVPSTSGMIAGLLNVRGEILTIVDLRALLGITPAVEEDEAAVLLAHGPGGQFGLLVDRVVETRYISLDTLDRSLSGRDYVRGVADGTIALLDLERLVTQDRLEVADDGL